MLEQQPNLLQAEVASELTPQEQFVTNLYQKTLDWLTKNQQGKIVADFDPQEISRWTEHEGRDPGTTVWLSMDLEKGAIIQTNDRIFALVIGKQLQSRYSHERTLSFQFGMLPTDSRLTKGNKDIDMIRIFTHQRMWTYGSGEFFVNDMTGEVTIDCWADGGRFTGGKEIGKWTQEQLLTDGGTNACLEIVQRTSQNAFTR